MTEHEHQKALIKWVRLTGNPDLAKLFAIPNGGQRHVVVAAKLKSEGVSAGVPDLFLPVARFSYHGLFIEMKTEKGTVSLAQKERIRQLNDDGYLAIVCYGWIDAKNRLTEYLACK